MWPFFGSRVQPSDQVVTISARSSGLSVCRRGSKSTMLPVHHSALEKR